MSKAMTYLVVRDFPIIRISCHHSGCGIAFELEPSQVAEAMKKTGACCPLCGKPFTKPDVDGGSDQITKLANVILSLNKLGSNVGIHFPLPINEGP